MFVFVLKVAPYGHLNDIAWIRLDSAPSSLVADREVAEEDGGWQSATNIEYQRQIQQSNRNTNRCGDSGGGGNDTASVQPQHHELPIIDFLDNINDHMDIELKSELKSEPVSPRMDELESCLLSNHAINEHLDSTMQDKIRQQAQPQRQQMLLGRASSNGAASFAEQRWLLRKGSFRHQDTSRAYNEQDNNKIATNSTYCSFCHKNFSRAWSLQRHLADTHFYVPQSLSCDLCGRSYRSKNSLVSHKSQYHGKKERKENEAQCEVT